MDFLLEIGTEELPASFVSSALDAMPDLARTLFVAERLEHGAMRTLGTPRRLTLLVHDLAARQRDVSEEVIGPPRSIAIGDDDKPTRAGIGFAKKHGLPPEALKIVSTDKGEYVAVQRAEAGRPAAEILPQLLPQLCARIPFPKSMRWGEGNVAFGRPVHWLVCLHGEAIVRFEFAGVTSDRQSRGHRFLAPETFAITTPQHYVERLATAHVLVDVEQRKAAMECALAAAAKVLGGEIIVDEFLVRECASLVEEPHVVPGSFDPVFLSLPDAVIVSVLRDHQRYFAVRDATSRKLLPRYLNVVNTANDAATIAKGNDRVLRARLADARFFVTEDQKTPLRERVPRLDKVVFQNKLGSIGDKVRRIIEIAPALGSGHRDATLEAARLCKSDLETLMVGEFPELQGQMGRFYAAAQGIPAVVSDAIADHYAPRGASDQVPAHVVAAAIAVADRIDTLAGCFGIGLVPSGSADPFALRRAALGIVRIALEGPMDVELESLVDRAYRAYEGQGTTLARAEAVPALQEFFRARLKALYAQTFPGDVIDACLSSWGFGSVRDLDSRVRALAAFRSRPEFESIAIAFKRAFNIAKDARTVAWRDELLIESAERDLASRFQECRARIHAATDARDYGHALGIIATELREPIDRFFEEVMVMVDDEKLRTNRLALLGSIATTAKRIAHLEMLS